MRAPHRSCAPAVQRRVDSRRTAPPQVRQAPPRVQRRAHEDAGARSDHGRSAFDGRALSGLHARRRRSCRRARRGAPSRIRSQRRAPQCALQMGVRRARARRDQAPPATLRRRVARDRMAHDSSTTPRVRQDSVAAVGDRAGLVRHSRRLQVHLQLRPLSVLVQVESQSVAAHLLRVGAGPLLVLL